MIVADVRAKLELRDSGSETNSATYQLMWTLDSLSLKWVGQDGQQMHEKILNITHQQTNTNQNCNEITPHNLSKWLKLTTQ